MKRVIRYHDNIKAIITKFADADALDILRLCLCLFILLSLSIPPLANARAGGADPRARLLKSVSQKRMVETARDYQWSIDFTKRGQDTIHIIALRVDFLADTSSLTTGNGRFGMRGDIDEQRFYAQDTTYRFDKLAHDSLYFAHQLTALRNYYSKVSRGNLTLDFTVYPSGSGEVGYTVPHQMTHYSPGWKRRAESIHAYWDRKTHGLIMFIRDAINVANTAADSPFRNLVHDETTNTLRVLKDDGTLGHKVAILIFHAGASYLTDGGLDGAAAADTPSDMIDAFIDPEFFKSYRDTLGLDTAGITVIGGDGVPVVIDEVMMSAETSNQDGLNWGIQGILVNQMARQLGIPDLFSTASGVSAVGAFCIMDFAGYSAGQGFIPPYPSAWVRAFMGWDTPRAVGAGGQYNVKALTSVLDRVGAGSLTNGNDTTILLVPINNNEYYLIENRQRNLSGDKDLFRYDTLNIINAYPFNVNIPKNVKTLSGTASNVILEAKNNDISLPASGVLVWHIDERVIRRQLAYNFVNADSSYRGVRLVEADGVNDLGVTFTDAFYQAAFDYGGAEDVFPYETLDRNGNILSRVNGFGPHTRPSTRANDGGHTYLEIGVTRSNSNSPTELSLNFQRNTVRNYSDSLFIVSVKNDPKTHVVQGWPRRAAPEAFFDPLITEIAAPSASSASKDTVLTILSASGRLYMYSVNKNTPVSYGNRTVPIKIVGYSGDTVQTSVTAAYLDSIPGAFTFPTAMGGRVYVPSSSNNRHVINVYNSTDITDATTITLPAAPSSYVCGIVNNTATQSWAVGLSDGRVAIGSNDAAAITIVDLHPRTNSREAVSAVAALKDTAGSFVVMQNDGSLSIIKNNEVALSTRDTRDMIRNGHAPFRLVTGNLDNDKDSTSEIVVSDSRQGVWVFTRDLKLAREWGWRDVPNDWANTYHIDPNKNRVGRDRFPVNFSAPALADLNRDGNLDIIISGTNGIYALNRKGALLSRWPAYLDNRYWYQRGSVASSPIVVSSDKREPLVLFSSPTGENATFVFTKIITADKARGVVTFRRENGTLDSLWDMSAATIDTILTLSDSLIAPYVLPGGFVDALDANAARPVQQIGAWRVPQSRWPLTAGAPVTTSPLAYRVSASGPPDLFAVSSDGMVYRWKLTGMLADATQSSWPHNSAHVWPQTGFDAARSFAFGGAPTAAENIITTKEPITFWNYPNPTSKDDPQTTFKYKFNKRATNVRLDIYTMTGKRMDTFKNLSGDFPDWNEFKINLRKYGPGIYRCRMEATIDGKKHSRFWKMAVVK